MVKKVDFKLLRVNTVAIKPILNDKGYPKGELCSIPTQLNGVPDQKWIDIFLEYWKKPTSYPSIHKPNNASVENQWLVLTDISVNDFKKAHLKTLKEAIKFTNNRYNQLLDEKILKESERKEKVRIATEQARKEAESIEI